MFDALIAATMLSGGLGLWLGLALAKVGADVDARIEADCLALAKAVEVIE